MRRTRVCRTEAGVSPAMVRWTDDLVVAVVRVHLHLHHHLHLQLHNRLSSRVSSRRSRAFGARIRAFCHRDVVVTAAAAAFDLPMVVRLWPRVGSRTASRRRRRHHAVPWLRMGKCQSQPPHRNPCNVVVWGHAIIYACILVDKYTTYKWV